MILKRIYCIACLLVSIASSFAQNATVTFVVDKDCEVFLYAPIDGANNNKVPKDRLLVTTETSIAYSIEVAPYMFLFCQIPQYQKEYFLLLFPGDSTEVHLKGKNVTFRGSNHVGQQYFYDNFQKESTWEASQKMQKIADEYLNNKRGMQTIIPAIFDTLKINSYFDTIKDLPLHSNTTSSFSEVLEKEAYMYFHWAIVECFQYIQLKKREKNMLTAEDSIAIRQQVDGIYEKLPFSYELMQYPSDLYVLKYTRFYYNEMKCPAAYDPEICGPYSVYLFAPIDMQAGLLGSACLVHLKYDSGEMNIEKFKKFFNERFPNSEFLPIINKRIKEYEDLVNNTTNEQIFVEEKIDSLVQLNRVQPLQGKYLFIDLWASWCIPCREEFSHKEQVDNILSKHPNIATVYISLDTGKQEKAWRNCIKRYQLTGYHLCASPELVADITSKVYGSARLDIPRYILLNPDGVILHKDLPRPSNYTKLEDVVDSMMK